MQLYGHKGSKECVIVMYFTELEKNHW